jgi:general secretion pathway protein D
MKRIVLFTIIAFTLWGCVTLSQSYRLGNQAEMVKNWDGAIKHYEEAIVQNPKESVYRLALLRAKISATYFHLQEARKLVSQGKKEEALVEYNKALSYDPLNQAIIEEAKSLTEIAAKKEEPKKGMYEFPIKLKVKDEKIQLKFVDASLRAIFQALGKHAEVNIIFDEQFKDVPLSLDLTDKDFEQAVNFVCMASRNFYRIIDEKTIIVIPDQPMKRLQYDANVIKTFYLSNINAQDIQNSLAMMLRTQFKTPNIIIDKNLNSVTIRDTPSIVALSEKLIKIWDRSKGEVVIDLEIMEVSRVREKQIGANLGTNAVGLKYSTDISDTTGWYNLKDVDFTKTGNFFISLPTALVQFLETDVDTKIIAQPRLRGLSDEEIKYLVGQKVPIPQTTFTPIAAGGVSQQPIMSYTQQDVGIDVKIKPKIHFEKEITLELEVKITSLGGTGIADIPIINTREVKNIIRLKDGETNLMAGLLREEERKTLKGIAGLMNIPILGRLFSNTDQTIEQTDVILTITPHIIRTIPLNEEDLKPLWVDVEEGSLTAGLGLQRGAPGAQMPEPQFMEEQPSGEEAAANEIFLDPANFEVPVNREFRISVNMNSEQEVANMTLNLSFDAKVMRLKDVMEGGIVRQLGEKIPFFENIDNTSGSCTIGFSSPEPSRGVKGGGSIAVLVFEAATGGEVTISISSVTANSPTGKAVSFETSESQIVVR